MADVFTDDPAPWVELLPDDVPDDYVAAVRAEAKASARQAQFAKITADLEAKLAAGAANPGVDPATLMTQAAKLAAARTLASVAPSVVPVSRERHDMIVSQLPRPNPARFHMCYPPAFLGELVHYTRSHAQAGELPPVASALDLEAIRQYEVVAAQAAAQWRSLEWLDDGVRAGMESYIRAWADTVNIAAWDELLLAISELGVQVAEADEQRPPNVSCSQGRHRDFRLAPVDVRFDKTPWTLQGAVRDGVLVSVTAPALVT